MPSIYIRDYLTHKRLLVTTCNRTEKWCIICGNQGGLELVTRHDPLSVVRSYDDGPMTH